MSNQLKVIDEATFKRAETYIRTAFNFAGMRYTDQMEGDYRLYATDSSNREICVAEYISPEMVAGYDSGPIYKVHMAVLEKVQHRVNI